MRRSGCVSKILLMKKLKSKVYVSFLISLYIALIEDRAIVKFSRITCSVGAILFNVGHLVEAVDVTKTSNFLALTTDNIWTDFVLH